CARDQSNYDYW
nr:immunoglobulin heavy chain junction region [Macaca mulatta]MOW98092.1 immunoglobulin heavy chain junction region [Macaca mulatta]MOW98153.1 immunoglobulin heavy chain junction region [Macaca mulatta]MOW98196.1 immunoglobulin heavy chain junction region [Macaca mulatta]MOW98300.1 immunoglobulin heavy chain junction region [Macaca mulatta]